jgi:hypothetical protein
MVLSTLTLYYYYLFFIHVKVLRSDAVPYLFMKSETAASSDSSRRQRLNRRDRLRKELNETNSAQLESCEVEEVVFENCEVEEMVYTSDANGIATSNGTVVHHFSPIMTSAAVLPTFSKQLFSAATLDDKLLHYYTGLESYAKFKLVLATLGSAVNHLVYYNGTLTILSIEDQFLLTLMKLRVHHPNSSCKIPVLDHFV